MRGVSLPEFPPDIAALDDLLRLAENLALDTMNYAKLTPQPFVEARRMLDQALEANDALARVRALEDPELAGVERGSARIIWHALDVLANLPPVVAPDATDTPSAIHLP
jgi:hypothetical protein